ncbi:leucine-rich_repeat domain-containing protein [Hexamita inflata]|uniref:Leucine-rich repeat domain-containing protein n=1 Tax=Hexamita inflata TaxID=28002 RepID=A0AA86TWV2_9EUKA|nr:leucine-rich repeat domain-containing protein [Hexamita inflata]
MQPNHAIRNKEDLLNLFRSQTLQIFDLEQIKKLFGMNIPQEVWEHASNKNLLSFSQEFVQQTKVFGFKRKEIQYCYLISFLTNLTELDLSNNKISDISSIYKLTNIKKLNLCSNHIEDISVLQYLTDLTHFNIQQNLITFYKLALPNLIDLKLGCNSLEDKSGLQHSLQLEILNLSETETTDLLRTIPHQLFGLKDLSLYKNNIIEISYISNFVDLQILSLSCNQQLQNIGPLKFCTQLTELSISETNVADIWPLQFMKNLRLLSIDNTQVIDLHPLQYLYRLEVICADNSCIIDISPLSNWHAQLKFLTLINNKITNEETLKHHQNFSEYYFSDQQVPSDIELNFYNKILSVYNSYKQIRTIKIIT